MPARSVTPTASWDEPSLDGVADNGGVIDRTGLADFLRRRRELLRPADVGLPDGVRRRAPGLRREEVAQLAGMSSDYLSRLEQGRGSRPSEPIVAALALALHCDSDQRDHLFRLAGLPPPPRRAGRHIRPGLISLTDRLVDVPVCICTDLEEVLWQNPFADTVLGPQDHRAGEPDVTALVHDLSERSAEFRTLWERHDVAVRRSSHKRMTHPEVGLLHLTCEALLTPEEDLKMLVFLPIEGTDTRDKLNRLRVIETQNSPRRQTGSSMSPRNRV